jgi:oxazoline/thiazoline synthase
VDFEFARADLIVVAWEQPDLSRVLSANHAVITRRVPCLFVDLSHGQHATLGPFYVPNEGACYECYRQWWRRNSRALTELDAAHEQMLTSGRPHPAYGTLPAFRHWLAGMAAAELQALVAGHRPLRTLNRQITIDLEHLAVHGEPVWRIPWCPACGDPPRQLATERSPAS